MRTLKFGLILLLFINFQPSFAICRLPTVTIKDFRTSAEARFTLIGRGFTADCNDPFDLVPAKGIRILFVQGDTTVEISRIDADAKLEFSATVTIPKSAKTGDARLVVEMPSGDQTYKTAVKVTITAPK